MQKTVLIVDDSATIRQQVRFALSEGSFELIEACDGAEGLDRLSENAQVSLIISDINMPKMNGLEMIETIY